MAATPATPPPRSNRATLDTLSTCLAQPANAVQEALDCLRSDENLKTLDLSFPRIIVIGSESCGKSTVLERLIGMRVFPKADGICTRMPIELRLFHKPESELGKGKVKCRLGIVGNYFKSDELEEVTEMMSFPALLKQIKPFHDERVIAKNGSLTGIIEDVMVVEIHSSMVHNIRLLDLPGVIQALHPNEPLDLAEKSHALVQKHLRVDDTLVLAVVSAQEGIRSSLALRWVQEQGLQEKTVGVLTKSDLTKDPRAEFAKTPYRALVSLIEQGDLILSKGVVALKNHDTNLDPNRNLDDVTEEEIAWFTENFPAADYLTAKKAGLHAVSQRLVGLLKTYTKKSWVPKTIEELRRRVVQIQNQHATELGQKPQEGQIGFFAQALADVCADWNGQLLHFSQWSDLFPSPQELQDLLNRAAFGFTDPGEFKAWKEIKEKLIVDLRNLLNLWFTAIRDFALRPFLPTNPKRLHHFPLLIEKISEFFDFDVDEACQRCERQLRAIFDRYDANPEKRFKVPMLVTSLLRTAVFESCLTKFELENFLQCARTSAFLQQKLLGTSSLAEYLTESAEVTERRAFFDQQVEHLQSAESVIRASFC